MILLAFLSFNILRVSLGDMSLSSTYYTEILNRFDEIYPGLQNILSSKGLSVQAQDNYPLRAAIDQRGEQTINCAAKTSDGITHFALKSSFVLK